jgi:hypothetical protein
VSELALTDQIARHIPKGKRKGDESDGTPGVVDSDAFMPRADWPRGTGLEEYLSVTRVDHFPGDLEEKLTSVTKAIMTRIVSFNKEQSRIGVLVVQTVHDAAILRQKKLSVRVVDPAKDPSYAGIYGMDLEDAIIAQELARRAVLYRPRMSA